MNKNYFYSATTNTFYLVSMKQIYVNAGSFPDDAKLVSDEVYNEFSQSKAGKNRSPGEDGLPVWRDPPPPTKEQSIIIAKNDRKVMLEYATDMIFQLQDAVDLDMATDAEKKLLRKWKLYRFNVYRIDTSTAPNIDWPEKPE